MPATRPAVLLLHGQPGSPRDWNRVIAAIGARARAAVIARPGWFRGSVAQGLEANAAAALAELDRLEIDRAAVVGHSLGGAVAAWLAASHPERVRALILVSPAANVQSLTSWDRLLAMPLLGDALSAAALAGAGSALALSPVRAAIGTRLGLEADYLRSSARLLLSPAVWRSFTAEQRALIRELPLLERRLGQISAPTTVVAGTEDRIVPVAASRQVAAQIPGARLVELQGAHHLLHQQRAAQLADIIVMAAAP